MENPKFKPEPEIKPAVNPFASEQIIRTIPEKGVVPLPIVGGRINRFKFRIYDKGNEQYLDPEDMDCVCHLPNGCFTIATWDGIQGDMKYWADEDIVVEMSTGLKDKNGNLIYEGDYIRDKYMTVFVVKWVDSGFIMTDMGETQPDAGLRQGWLDLCEFEIVGNIHEQAEQGEKK